MNKEDIFNECMREMFRRVDLPLSDKERDAYCKSENWYMTKSWTEEEEEDFRKWMHKYLAKKTRWYAHQRKSECSWFLLMWGWTNSKVEEKK